MKNIVTLTKLRLRQWWSGEKVMYSQVDYVPRLVEDRPWIRKLYERLPTWVWVALGMGALKRVGEEAVKWLTTW